MSRSPFRPQVESLDDRVLPSGNPAITIGDAALVAPKSIPQPVAITATKGFGDFTPGAFSASGGINDSGVYQLIDAHDAALPSAVVGTAHDTVSLAGTLGAITIKSETVFKVVSFDPLVFGEDGHWLIVDGTADYANLKGEGEFHKLIDVSLGQITITLTGKVHSPKGPAADAVASALHTGSLQSQSKSGEATLTLTVDLEAELRTWIATGAIEDSGSATTVRIQFGAFGAPTKSVLLIDTLFTNADGTGTFTIRRTIISTADGPDLFVRDGTWHVVDATGIYAGLRGHGKLTGTEFGDTLVVDILTGSLKNGD